MSPEKPTGDAASTPGARTPRIGFSIHNKVLALTGIVLLLVVLLALTVFWNQTGHQYRYEVEHGHHRLASRFNNQFDQQRDDTLLALRVLAGVLANSDLASDPGATDALVADTLLTTGLDLEFEQVSVHLAEPAAADPRMAAATEPTAVSEVIREIGAQVVKTRSPGTALVCNATCTIVAGEPGRDAAGRDFAMVGERSVADWVVSFARIDGANVALMAHSADTATPKVIASSGGERITDVVAQAMNDLFVTSIDDMPLQVQHGGTVYSIGLADIEFGGLRGIAPRIAIIIDITERNRLLGQLRLGASLLTVAVLITALVTTRQILRPITRRVHRLARALPLIADGEFTAAQSLVAGSDATRWLDEVDVLEITSRDVIARLRGLSEQVADRDRALNERIAELRRQGEFVDRLLENTQLAILVHNGRRTTLSCNASARELLEHRSDDTPDSTLFATEPSERKALRQHFEVLDEHGILQPFITEASIDGEEGQRHLQWKHCSIEGPDGERLILSTGLDLTRERKALAEMSWMADHDSLTGLFNRRRFDNELDNAITAQKPFAVLFIDLDGFALVNKSEGHQAGNEVLITVARLLQRNLPVTDMLARTGGDEFMVLLDDADSEVAMQVAGRLVKVLSTRIRVPAGSAHEISCCIGISLYPQQGPDRAELLRHADAALVEAKRSGRGEWMLRADTSQLTQRSKQTKRWKECLIEALANDRLFLVYQPIAALPSGAISHYECLVRLRLPDDSIANPGEFIPVAEDIGMIHRVDYWVLEHAVSQLRRLSELRPDIGLAVNVSGPTLQRADFLPTMSAIISRSGLSRPRLILEVTETAALHNLRMAKESMAALCELGCRFALDDFGVGFSSFAYLRELPFAYVKLDGSYVRQVLLDQRNQAFVRAMVQLAKGYQLKTIAEFVETQEVMDFLSESGINYGQGYHIAKPGPLPDFQREERTGNLRLV